MSKPMTRKEWLSYLEQTWDAAQKAAWSEQQRREWVGLTDAELAEFSEAKLGAYDLCLEVEAKLRERNT